MIARASNCAARLLAADDCRRSCSAVANGWQGRESYAIRTTPFDEVAVAFLASAKKDAPVEFVMFMEGKPQPKTKAKAPAKDDSDPALQGWKARDCKAVVKNGIVRVTNIGFECFLGFGAGKHSGPSTAIFRIKAK
ncbi:MAG: hypothetical protein WCL13_04130, partial [bacterium]